MNRLIKKTVRLLQYNPKLKSFENVKLFANIQDLFETKINLKFNW